MRDTTPALGAAGGPGRWERLRKGAKVALHRDAFEDARWSFLYDDTEYATAPPQNDAWQVPESDGLVQGPVLKAPVWTWEVPLYFWVGGIAAGSSFVALACDLAGDHRSARTARMVSLVALAPSPPLLIADLGRPERFVNMLRVFKPRSPMSMGAWCLTLFGNLGAGAVAADLLGRERLARSLGGANAVVGGYLGSYTGVLLAVTAVPVWARSRLFLGPIFVSTATATGAAACRLTLAATGLPADDATNVALRRVEAGAMAVELLLSSVNERRLGTLAAGLENRWFRAAKWLVRAGLGMRLLRLGRPASAAFLAAGLCFRFAWIAAGRTSASDHEAAARVARESS